MKNLKLFILLGLGLTSFVAVDLFAITQEEFNMTVEQFRQAFDRETIQGAKNPNVADTIKSINKISPTTYHASLKDDGFNSMVKGWKVLNLANGKFILKEKFIFRVGSSGLISNIELSSSRADMNLFHFMDTFANTVKVFNPQFTEKDIQELVKDVGLMRGDNDPTIGESMNSFTRGVAIECLSQPSNVSSTIVCKFYPRS